MINLSSTVKDHVKAGGNGNKTNNSSNKNLKMEKGRKKRKNSTDYIYSTFLESWTCAEFTNENIRSIVDIKELDLYNSLGYFEVKMRWPPSFPTTTHPNNAK